MIPKDCELEKIALPGIVEIVSYQGDDYELYDLFS
jgi:hypothetical protein